MPRKNKIKQEKVVFMFDPSIKYEHLNITEDTLYYVENILFKALENNNVSTCNVFIGGSIDTLSKWLCELINNYESSSNKLIESTTLYIDDTDFNIPES